MRTRLVVPTVLAVLSLWAAPAAAQSCGGPYQPLCKEFSCFIDLGPLGCAWGVDTPAGPYGGCSNPSLNPNIFSDECQPCGGDGQATCPYREQKCDSFHNDLGISCSACGGHGRGMCLRGPTCQPGHVLVGPICVNRGHSEEPTVNLSLFSAPVLLSQPGDEPVKGIADLHTHQFANLGFGGALFHGEPFNPNGIDEALEWCDFSEELTFLPTGDATPRIPGIGYAKHGPSGALDLVSHGTTEGMHSVSGTGSFSGWPKWSSATHQQMYYTWVRRAYLGGLRLMVMHAVSNEALCNASLHTQGTCDDMPAVDAQLDAAKNLEKEIDKQAGGTGRGWYRIAYSPAEAREIIRSGKLAVILGIEVDGLFGCNVGSACTPAYDTSEVARYYAKGVRHIFPVHVFDNDFGGAALYSDLFNSGNVLVNSRYFNVEPGGCPVGFEVGPDMLSTALDAVYSTLDNIVPGLPFGTAMSRIFGTLDPPAAAYAASNGDCNVRGLSPLGETLIREMMRLGMIIDVDHMSRKTRDSVYAIARERGYPLVSGHSSFAALNDAEHTSEYSLTADDLTTIKQLGGMVTIPPPRGPEGTTADYKPFYDYVIEQMRGGAFDASAQHPGIAFSTDFNGLVPQTAPRFGAEAPAGAAAAGPALDYLAWQTGAIYILGFELPVPTLGFKGPLGGSFTAQQTGDRVFDFNTQGLAHIGLLPDFFADLKNVGFTDADLEPMMNSADTYIRMWERTGTVNVPRPTATVEIDGTAGNDGWYTSNVQVSFTVTDDSGLATRAGCDPVTIAEDTAGTTLTCVVTPATGEPVTATTTIRRDATAPVFALDGRTPAAGPFGWNNTDVTVSMRCEDATSGPRENPGAGHVYVLTNTIASDGIRPSLGLLCVDVAGNQAVAFTPAVKIDKTPPAIALRSKSAPNPAGWNNAPVELVWDCVDNRSGFSVAPGEISLPDGSMRTRTVTQVIGEEGAAVSANMSCTDRAGNSASASVDGLQIDLTPPSLTLPTPVSVQAPAFDGAMVTYPATAVDILSGASAPQCAPASGGLFPVGVTAVTCTASDAAGNAAAGSFAVDVKAPGIPEIVTLLDAGIAIKRLDKKLNEIVRAIDDERDKRACKRIDQLRTSIDGHRSLTAAEQAELLFLADRLTLLVPCGTEN